MFVLLLLGEGTTQFGGTRLGGKALDLGTRSSIAGGSMWNTK